MTCPDDGKTTVPVRIKIDDIDVQMTEDHTNKIQITDSIGLMESLPIIGEERTVMSYILNPITKLSKRALQE